MPISPISVDDWCARAQYFEFRNYKIAFWDSGEIKSKHDPLLLIHGYPTASWDWSWLWDDLIKTRRVVVCDMLGFGLSGKPKSGYSIHLQADLQDAFLTHLNIDTYDALVHDYGNTVGQELLARRNENSARAVLGRMCFLNGGLFPEQHRQRPVQKLGVSPFGFVLPWLMNRKRFGKSFSEVFGPHTQPSEQELDGFWKLICHNDGHKTFHKLLHYIADRREHRERWVGALQNSRVPIRLVDGGMDPVSGKHMYEYFREIVPNGEAVLLPELGHYPHTEGPDQVLREITPFFSL
ncbi:MAG: alpha/beta hydrolase [Hyphomonadaceae bacterium]|nr:alpha/beta hydrolase [Hyphomonadaceae bacterium]